MMGRTLPIFAAYLLACIAWPSSARGVFTPPALKDVAIEQKLDVQVPADLSFTDEQGRPVRLADFYGKRPLVLALVYYECPMLCTMVLNDLARSMNAMKMSCGEDFDVLTISFNPRDTPLLARAKKENYLRAYQRPRASEGWHFLTGSQDSISRLTDTVGFRYAWDAKFQQYAHASGIIILSPQGKTTRYFYGIDYAPADLQLSLAEAAGGKSSSVADRILLYCFHYDATTGRYTVMINRIVQACGIATVLALGLYILVTLKRERARPVGIGPQIRDRTLR
jgi:protein SCO1/2